MAAVRTSLDHEIETAREGLRGIEDNLKTLVGRPFGDRFGRGGGLRGRLGERPAFVGGQKRRITFGAPTAATSGGFRSDDFEDDGGMRGSTEAKRVRRSIGGDSGSSSFVVVPPASSLRPVAPKAVTSIVVMPTIETKSRDDALKEMSKVESKQQVGRNRRMFANLLGTLGKFSKEASRTTGLKEQAKKQSEVEKRLEQEKKDERERLEKERRELLLSRKEKEEDIKRLQRKRAFVQYAEREEANLRRLGTFIQTQATPPIFYMPAKHTLRTLELQKNTAKKYEELALKRHEQLERDMQTVEASKERMAAMNAHRRDVAAPLAISGEPSKAADDDKRKRGERELDDDDDEEDDDVEGDEEQAEADDKHHTDQKEDGGNSSTDEADEPAAKQSNGEHLTSSADAATIAAADQSPPLEERAQDESVPDESIDDENESEAPTSEKTDSFRDIHLSSADEQQ